jgi:hypothetical protein
MASILFWALRYLNWNSGYGSMIEDVNMLAYDMEQWAVISM